MLRIPALPANFINNPFGLYYTNVIMDIALKSEERFVIVPIYAIPPLDSTAISLYMYLGFNKVAPFESILPGLYEAGPRCLVQIIGYPAKFEAIEIECLQLEYIKKLLPLPGTF